jgi:alcohol dehydrogenase class IV
MAHWRNYIFENDDEAAKQIMLAANYGGRAINITQTTAAHAFSYKITSLYKLPHGHAVAVCLPVIWKYMIGNFTRCIDSRGIDYLERIFNEISSAMGCSNPIEAIDLFENMMTEMNLHNPVAGERDVELTALSTSVNPVRLKNNPIQIDEETAKTLYNSILA